MADVQDPKDTEKKRRVGRRQAVLVAPDKSAAKVLGREAGAVAAAPPHQQQETKASEPLLEPGEPDFDSLSAEERLEHYQRVETQYWKIVEGYRVLANLAVKRHMDFARYHSRWRAGLIWATGGLAAVNTIAAFQLLAAIPGASTGLSPVVFVSSFAAIYAVLLTVLNNVENFRNNGERAAAFRDTREVFLDIYQDYMEKWTNYVEAYGPGSSRSCVNAGRLYRELVQADRDLRATVRDLTEVGPRAPSPAGQGGAVAGS